jgi:hypothetical protein
MCPLHRNPALFVCPGMRLILEDALGLSYWIDFKQVSESKTNLKWMDESRWKLFYQYFVPAKF